MRYVHGSRCRSETDQPISQWTNVSTATNKISKQKTKIKQTLHSHSPRFNSQVTINQLNFISYTRIISSANIFAAMNDIEQNEEKPKERKAQEKSVQIIRILVIESSAWMTARFIGSQPTNKCIWINKPNVGNEYPTANRSDPIQSDSELLLFRRINGLFNRFFRSFLFFFCFSWFSVGWAVQWIAMFRCCCCCYCCNVTIEPIMEPNQIIELIIDEMRRKCFDVHVIFSSVLHYNIIRLYALPSCTRQS